MSIWNIIIIVCIALLVLYLILDKLIMPVIRHRRNQAKASRCVFATIFDPRTNLPEHSLLERDGDWFVKAPEAHKSFFLRGSNGDKEKHMSYSVMGMEIVGYDEEHKAIQKPVRATVRDLWPPNVKETEQVLVEHGYWIKGRTQALNPYNDFFPVNTGRMNQTLKDEKTAEAFAKVSQRMLENWETIEKSVQKIAKYMTWVLFAALGSALASITAAVLAYMIKKAM